MKFLAVFSGRPQHLMILCFCLKTSHYTILVPPPRQHLSQTLGRRTLAGLIAKP